MYLTQNLGNKWALPLVMHNCMWNDQINNAHFFYIRGTNLKVWLSHTQSDIHFNAVDSIPRSPSWSSTYLVSAAFWLPLPHWGDSVVYPQTSPCWPQTKFKAKQGEYLRTNSYWHLKGGIHIWALMKNLIDNTSKFTSNKNVHFHI